MKANELIEKLSELPPETEILTGVAAPYCSFQFHKFVLKCLFNNRGCYHDSVAPGSTARPEICLVWEV